MRLYYDIWFSRVLEIYHEKSPRASIDTSHENKKLIELATAVRLEIWAVIDQNTYRVKEVGVGTRSRAVGIYDNTYRKGDSLWHFHPSGDPIHAGDWGSAFIGGGRGSAQYILASGRELTGYNLYCGNLPFSNPTEYKATKVVFLLLFGLIVTKLGLLIFLIESNRAIGGFI